MKTFTIEKEAVGRSLGRYLDKLLPKAPQGFFFKALRTNKIKLNGCKPKDLKFLLCEGDELKLFLTDEQFADFGYREVLPQKKLPKDTSAVKVLYEDENLLVLHKPAGMLSQRDSGDEFSLNEYGLAILEARGIVAGPAFTPGVLNRLDRNTSGCVMMAKNLETAQKLSAQIAGHKIGKFYLALCEGSIPWSEKTLKAHWTKDAARNTAAISNEGAPVELFLRVLKKSEALSLAEIALKTGKSHQIRAQLAAEGFPLLGDRKYGYKGKYGLTSFAPHELMLCAYKLVFPEGEESYSGKCVTAELPARMKESIVFAFDA